MHVTCVFVCECVCVWGGGGDELDRNTILEENFMIFNIFEASSLLSSRKDLRYVGSVLGLRSCQGE